MRICVYGAGAIGGHLAVRYARGGADVSVVARGAHLAAIQRDGLSVHTNAGELRAHVAASDDPSALGPQDAVVVTVKAPALPSVAAGIGPLLRPDTPVAFVMKAFRGGISMRCRARWKGAACRASIRMMPCGAPSVRNARSAAWCTRRAR